MPPKILLLLGCAAIALALSASPAVAREQPRAFTRALEKGEALMDQGEYKAAIDSLKKAERLSTEPSPRVLTNLAVSFNNVPAGSARAERYARAALESAQESGHRAGALNQLGISLLAGSSRDPERLAEAEAAFRTVLELTGGEAGGVLYSLAEAVRRQGRFLEARTAFAKYLAYRPQGELSVRAQRAIEWTSCMESAGPSLPRQMGGEVGRPTKLSGPGPSYTPEARSARIQGVVILEAVIDAQGVVRCPLIVKGLPGGLSEVAVKTVSQWKFKPAELDGQPIAVNYNITMNFRLGR